MIRKTHTVWIETEDLIKRWLTLRIAMPIRHVEAILAAAITPDGQDIHLDMSTREYLWKGLAYKRHIHKHLGANLCEIFRQLIDNRLDDYMTARSFRVTLLLTDYIGFMSNRYLEEKYQINISTIKRVSKQISWILASAVDLAGASEYPETFTMELNLISNQVQFGLLPEGVFLAQLRVPGLGRERIMALIREGIRSYDEVLGAGKDYIGQHVTKPVADELFRRIKVMKRYEKADELTQNETGPHKAMLNNGVILGDNRGVWVGVNKGSIIIHKDNGDKKQDKTDKSGNADGPDDLTALRTSEWRTEVRHRIESISPAEIKELFEEIRTVQHNRLRPLLRDVSKCYTLEDFKIITHNVQCNYRKMCRHLTDRLGAIVLPRFSEDFKMLFRIESPLDDLKGQLDALSSRMLIHVTRVINLLEESKVSPEAMILEAVEACDLDMDNVTIDSTGLLPCGDRLKSFYRITEMIEAFTDLIRNAAESMYGMDNSILILSSGLSGGQTVLRIADNGRGIKPEDVKRIFDDNFSTKGSDGFGLAHAKKVIEANGGSLRFLGSESDTGATFEVRI